MEWLIGTVEKSYNSLIRKAHCPLPYAPHDPESMHHHLLNNPKRQPKSLQVEVVTLTYARECGLKRKIQVCMGRAE